MPDMPHIFVEKLLTGFEVFVPPVKDFALDGASIVQILKVVGVRIVQIIKVEGVSIVQ